MLATETPAERAGVSFCCLWFVVKNHQKNRRHCLDSFPEQAQALSYSNRRGEENGFRVPDVSQASCLEIDGDPETREGE
jgi:hypothetical protein